MDEFWSRPVSAPVPGGAAYKADEDKTVLQNNTDKTTK
jgi:hypothetical protein